ncbi:MAG TPA: hypothetical protein VMS73_04665 [Anaerolineaceae bacterium]|nr:hypothetical protein [Anaerolineaceae bacterium]
MASGLSHLTWAATWRIRQWQNDRRLLELVQKVARQEMVPVTRPVIFFNASTRLLGLSQNAAFSLLAGWALRLAGTPVVNLTCNAGLKPCVLGTNRDQVDAQPPCFDCIEQSRKAFTGAVVRRLEFRDDVNLANALKPLGLEQLMAFEFGGLPLGTMVLPSLRWSLRRHTLADDGSTRFLFCQYIRSSWSLARQFERLLEDVKPLAVVVFNGMFYPEATARRVASQRGIPVISHEVALRPFTAFFTRGEATAYPINIPDSFKLTNSEDERLDAYLEQRFHGNFSMAGVHFWPEMRPLGEQFWKRAGQFKQIVPVFSNVIFDTSQGHANVIFPHMFAWLDLVLQIIKAHPETYFVIRAHPDEARPGKESRESVADWVKKNGVASLPNVLFVDSRQYFSSYELIQRSKFVMVYNSTIGLEATLLKVPVLCGGKARFTQLPTVFFPQSPADFLKLAEEFLASPAITVPAEFYRNARRFLYTQLFRTSLPMEQFIEDDGIRQGYVRFKRFDVRTLTPDQSPSIKAILDGILRNGSFLLEE